MLSNEGVTSLGIVGRVGIGGLTSTGEGDGVSTRMGDSLEPNAMIVGSLIRRGAEEMVVGTLEEGETPILSFLALEDACLVGFCE
jgi:hypothetical protein